MRTFLQVIERVDTVLGFPGTGLWLTVHPVLLFAQGVLDLGKLGSHPVNALFPAAQIVGVITLVDIDLSAVDFDDFVTYPVEKVAVMGDHQEGHFRTGKEVLKPFDGRYVKMVGRLVENQQVRFGGYDLGQSEPLALASGEGGDTGLGVKHFHLGQKTFQSVVATDILPDCLFVRKHRCLFQKTCFQVLARGDFAGIRAFGACDTSQEGGFSGSVFGNECYLVALVDAECDISENHPVAVAFREVLELEVTYHQRVDVG